MDPISNTDRSNGCSSNISTLQCAHRVYWAQCEAERCGGVSSVILSGHENEELRPDLRPALERRLRCICGARRARLLDAPPSGAFKKTFIYSFW